MRYARKKDANHNATSAAFVRAGYPWINTHQYGQGFPDGCTSLSGIIIGVEAKRLGEDLTPAERRFHAAWPGPIITAYGPNHGLQQMAHLESLFASGGSPLALKYRTDTHGA